MTSNTEAQAALILQEIVTEAEKQQAAEDVKHTSGAMWRSARLSLRLQAETDGELTVSACRLAVAELYGCADSTIRRREKAARLVDDELQDTYPDLTFSYWRTACDAHHLPEQTPLENMMDVICQIMEYREAFGKLPTVNTVEGWVYGEGGKLVWRSRLEGAESALEKVQQDTRAEQVARDLAGILRSYLVSYLETGRSPFKKAPS